MALRDSGKDSNSESDEQEITVTKKRIRRGKHELFDKIAFNVLSYLESFDEVGDIDISVPDGSPTFSAVWEGKHAPYVLPFDIKGFS